MAAAAILENGVGPRFHKVSEEQAIEKAARLVVRSVSLLQILQ
jgi:hypothetical protein